MGLLAPWFWREEGVSGKGGQGIGECVDFALVELYSSRTLVSLAADFNAPPAVPLKRQGYQSPDSQAPGPKHTGSQLGPRHLIPEEGPPTLRPVFLRALEETLLW